MSTDGEIYHGVFDTKEEAIAEGVTYGRDFFVGQCVAPVSPELLFDGDTIESWIDNEVLCHDDYSGEWAEDALRTTREQREQLAGVIRLSISQWLDINKLRPTHFNIDPVSVEEIRKSSDQ